MNTLFQREPRASAAIKYCLLLMLSLLAIPPMAQAQLVDPSLFSFSPDPPVAGQATLVTIHMEPCLHGFDLWVDGQDPEITVIGNQIEVVSASRQVTICLPPWTFDFPFQLPPLAVGSYDIVVYGQERDHPDDPAYRTPVYATTFSVVAGSSAPVATHSIPAASTTMLIALAGLLVLLVLLRTRSG